jgi:hypothetical protein
MLAFLRPDAFADLLNCAILVPPSRVARPKSAGATQAVAPSSLWLNSRFGAMADHELAPRRLRGDGEKLF